MSTQKSPDAFRTISEVAAELDVPQHVLRFWESKFSQIRPLKRGGGRRYYRPEDVDLLRGVRALLYNDGYTIKGVQKVFREQGVKFVSETGKGTVDASLAELAREAVRRSEREEEPSEGGAALDASAKQTLESILEELTVLKEEIDETLWETEGDEA
ncbi:MerR family transcriptional regulator [Parvibaculum sedimenti]|uniref:MerR family transcriptional regulator n=1 Tax=Parvibaculum sedimenti TaxID=2608632 RepID=A0A6N6VJP0_9HYPH|nr:MerR family transcriptional regulator [Parvibaculum sedimenti]KAB7740113.1 MerR family transcriptional regulator [Parvibaculum sedimenti]